MQQMGYIDGRTMPSTAAKEAYNSVFREAPHPLT
jgi:hypothetical protein